MKRSGFRRIAPLLIVPALLIALSAGVILSEEGGKSKKFKEEKAKAKREALYGTWWGFERHYTTLPLGKCFKFFRESWLEEFGKNPYRNSASPEAAEEQWYGHWIDFQLGMISENLNWELVARDGPYFTFKCGPHPEKPPAFCRMQFSEPLSHSEMTRDFDFPFPMMTPMDPAKYGRFACDDYSGYSLLVPPAVWSIRIYAPVALNPAIYYFPLDKYLNTPEAYGKLFDIRYDMNAMNVIRIYFRKRLPKFDNMVDPLRDRFWAWRQLAVTIGRLKQEKVGWTAWEFLDEDGKPLPADYPLPTRWFPDNFKEIFKPIPLPEDLDLPQVQD